jgi:hypothetical protein
LGHVSWCHIQIPDRFSSFFCTEKKNYIDIQKAVIAKNAMKMKPSLETKGIYKLFIKNSRMRELAKGIEGRRMAKTEPKQQEMEK